MDKDTLIAGLDFARARLLGTLDAIEKSGHDPAKVLAWRPAAGRAHMAWQFLHEAATHDKYFNVRLKGDQTPKDDALVSAYGGGSTPADGPVPSVAEIRSRLESTYRDARAYVAGLSNADLDRVVEFPNNVRRTVSESILLMIWHEAHHQGQIHLTWNLYKAAHPGA